MTTSETPLYLGIDVGTSGVRAIVVEQSGEIQATGKSLMQEHGDNRRDPGIWWSAVRSSLNQVSQTVDLSRVEGLCIDATSGTVLAIRSDGEPVANAFMYNDAISQQDILDRIALHAPAESAVHGASSGLARAIVLQQLHPDALIVHQADWIVGQLSGNYTFSDESNALKTGYDPVNRCWPEWMKLTGIDLLRLPKVSFVGEVITTVSDRIGAEFGFSNTKIIAGMTDGCASFLATGADQVGDSVTALGTTMTMKMLCNQPVFSPKYGIYSHRIGNDWLAGGASNTGGNVLAHYFDNESLQNLSKQIDVSAPTGYHYYPLLKPGERFPHNDAKWPAILQPRPDSDVLFLQGILEGIAEIESAGYQKMTELGAPAVRSVRTVGGGASNKVWQKIRESLIEAPFHHSMTAEAAAGVANFARKALS